MAIPSLLDLTVDGNSLVLRFSEALASVLPSASRFLVSINGVRRTVSGTAVRSTDGTSIRLNLATPVQAGDQVSVSYVSVNGFDKSGFGDIRSAATPNQKAAFFRNLLATNLTAPPATLTISADKNSLRAGESTLITFTFSRDPSISFRWDGSSGDVTLSGGTLSAISGSGLTRTAIFTPTAGSSGNASIAVAAGSYTDAAGNAGAASNSLSLAFDTLAPTLAISSDKLSLMAGESATITFAFSEDPGSSFSWDGSSGDVTLSGGTLSAISGSGLTRSAIFTPTAGSSGDASIAVAAGSYTDAVGNAGGPSSTQIAVELPTASLTAGLTASTDTGTVGDGITALSRVSLTGQALGGAQVVLRGSALRAVIAGDGSFLLPEVPLASGDNQLTLDLVDAGGLTMASRELQLTRESAGGATAAEDPVLAWNKVALEAIQRDAALPAAATRALAIQAIAVLDTLAAIDGTPAFLVGLQAPTGVPAGAAVAAAATRVLNYLYPAQKSLFQTKLTADLQAYSDETARQAAVTFGESVADVVIALRQNDGWDRFVVVGEGNQPGQWRPTPPTYELPQSPHWSQLTPFSLQSGSQFRPAAPPVLTSAAYADALAEVQRLGSATSTERTADQTQMARFWADGLGSYTPPGHWNQIAAEQASADGYGYGSAARLLAILNVALADSSIASWETKFTYNLWRPVTAIRNADTDGNAETTAVSDWQPLLITPNHPEYVSGHSTYSAAAAEVLETILGDRNFSTTSIGLPNVSRGFTSFDAAAAEAGRSRIYGGIHYEFSNQAGQVLGTQVADWVLNAFRSDVDLRGPQLALEPSDATVLSAPPSLSGFAVDNLSGVASLSVTLTGRDPQLLSIDGRGRFSLDVGALFGALADGSYGLTFQAVDGAGNASQPLSTNFRIDTTAPGLSITSLSDGDGLSAGTRLIGQVDGTGTAVKALSYRFNNDVARTLTFDANSGAFDVPLSLGSLLPGDQTLTITALDGAGLTTSRTLSLHLARTIPLTIEAISPADGSGDVGATFRPELSFSRAVDPTTVTSDSFWATDAAGNRLPGTIVMAPQGNRAWLLFEQAMPGSSRITLQVDGSKIRAAGDGQLLDADGDGTPGGLHSSAFTTVNLTPVMGTTLVGKVVGPGADLKPMSYDDFRAGPDSAAHTADDVFLEPLAGVKVFILGLENRAVYTDTQGNFELTDIPVGVVKVAIDGRTATNPPANVFYPEMVMDVTIRPAQVNTIMGTMGITDQQLENSGRREVYLPRINSSVLQTIANDQPTTVTTPTEGAPNLPEEQRQYIQLVVQPGSVIGENGQVLDNAQVGIATVPPELVRDMLPPGLLQHTFDLTIQAPGAAVFNTPLQLTLPNVFNAAPGTKLNLLSFDHTTGRLVIDGTGTVSADGLFVVTDPDSGITRPGWHGMTPPGSETTSSPPPPPPDDCEWTDIVFRQLPQLADAAATAASCARQIVGGKLDAMLQAIQIFSEVAKGAKNLMADLQALQESIKAGNTGETVLNSLALIKHQKDKYVGLFDAAKQASPIQTALDAVDCILSAVSTASSICNGLSGDKCLQDSSTLKALCQGLDAVARLAANIKAYVDDLEKLGNDTLLKVMCSTFDVVEAGVRNAIAQQQAPQRAPSARIFASQASESSLDELFAQLLADTQELVSNLESKPLLASELTTAGIELGPDVLELQTNGAYLYSRVYQNLPANAPYAIFLKDTQIRGRTDALGRIQAFLPAKSDFEVRIVDVAQSRIGSFFGITNDSGVDTKIPSLMYGSFVGKTDSDDDGLPDVAEEVIGTASSRRDTDRDGVSDLAEVLTGQDPLGGFHLPTGVVGSLALQGQARDMAIATDPTNTNQTLALITSGDALTVVDLTNNLSPSLTARLTLDGTPVSVAYDASTRLAAVATGSRLAIVDLSTPTSPKLVREISVAANQVEVLDGIAYVMSGDTLQAFDLLTGDFRSSVPFYTRLTGLAREGNMLYLQDQSNRIRVVESVDGTGDVLLERGFLAFADTLGSTGERKMFAAEGILYVPADNGFTGGFATVDVRIPSAPVLLSEPDDRAIAGYAIALTGSGRAVIVGSPGGVFGANAADVINTNDPLNTGALITRINMPSRPNDVAILNGFAYVATDTGLQVVNFLPRDIDGIAPTVSLDTSSLDLDPSTPGLQVQEGSSIPLALTLADDVLVSSVDVLLNGQVIRSDSTYPYDLRITLPSLSSNGGDTVSLQVRATDTGGNIGLSDLLSLDLTPDTIAPTIIEQNVGDGELVGRSFGTFRFTFSERVSLTAPVQDVIRLVPPSGVSVTGMNAVFRNNGRQLQLSVDPLLSADGYRLELDTSKILDGAGNSLGNSLQITSFSVSSYDSITYGTTGSDNLVGGQQRDLLSGGPKDNPASDYGYDYLDGSAGDDDLFGYGGYDYLLGGEGNDQLDVGADGGYANGGLGNDLLLGGDGSDILFGSGGLDSLHGGAGNDSLDDTDQPWEEAVYNPGNGHYYQLVTQAMSWPEALAMAAGSVLSDRQGYLATITSSQEQAFLATSFGIYGVNLWLGGSDADEEGTWSWINGPESGSAFFVQGESIQPGYSNWSAGEPNNFGNEDGLQMLPYSYQWNDLPLSLQWLYPLIEYGGLAGDGTDPLVVPGDVLNGGEGDDTIDSSGGNDSIDGGAGVDILSLDLHLLSEDVSLLLIDPTIAASLTSGGSVIGVEDFTIRSSAGNDLLGTGAGDDNLLGNDGADTLDGGAGYDTLYGGRGDDSLIGGDGSDNVSGEDGDDTLEGGAGYDNLDGGSGNDRLDLGAEGGNGNGGSGNDLLLGGDGSDGLWGSGGLDSLYGGAGNDGLGDGDQSWEDAVYNPGNGHWYQYVPFYGSWSQARDAASLSQLGSLNGYLVTITSAAEQAFINTSFGNLYYTWIGASDDDGSGSWSWLTGPENGLVFTNAGGVPTGEYSNWLSGQPEMSGSSTNRAIFRYFSNNDWYAVNDSSHSNGYLVEYGGLPGDSTEPLVLPGDVLNGGEGDDTIYSLGGNDSIDGGAGIDYLELNLSKLSQDVSLLLTDSTVAASLTSGGSVIGVERFSIRSGAGNDQLRTGAGDDNLQGGDGADTLESGAGYDYLYGGSGDDSLIGGDESDHLYGEDGDDTLEGGAGYDNLYGGSGNDRLDLGAEGAYGDGGSGNDLLLGGDDADDLHGGGGLDSLDGGAGNDRLDDGDQSWEDAVYNPGNGHWYQYVPSSGSWTQARDAASLSQLGSLNGYLVTITSAAEQAFINTGFGNLYYTWIGASDADGSGSWSWLTGPENGLVFTNAGGVPTGEYSNWWNYQPETSGSTANRAMFLYFNNNAWYAVNDSSHSNGYLVEYGGLPGDSTEPLVLPGDVLNGGEGDDTIYSRGGNDSIDGGAGFDYLELNLSQLSQDVSLLLTDSTIAASLSSGGSVIGVERFSIRSGAGNDHLRTGAGDDNLQGGDGADTLDGAAGYDYLYGGNGNDRLEAGADGATGDGGSGDDSLFGGDGSDHLQGGDGNDTVEGGAGYDDLYGNSGDDSLFGGDGSDHLYGEDGDDTLEGGAGYDNLYGGSGNDRLDLGAEGASGDGGSGNDLLLGGDGADDLYGGGGLDSLYGGAGNDSLNDGDQLWEEAFYNPDNGHWYKLVTQAMSWTDALTMAAGSVLSDRQGYLATMTSSQEQAFLASTFGSYGYDLWLGGSDADEEGTWTWINGPESGTIFFVQGQPIELGYSNWGWGEPNNYENEDGLQLVSYSNQWNDLPLSVQWLYPLIEYGGLPGDSTEPLVLPGDILDGGEGDDTIYSRGGNDRIDGGEGIDRVELDLSSLSQNVSLLLTDPTVAVSLTSGGSVIGVEDFTIRSGAGKDLLGTGAGDDNLQGNDGADTLDGGAGYDTLYGGSGDDSLFGGDESDDLQGGDGDDTLEGGAGYDTLYGGSGNDRLDAGADGAHCDGGSGSDLLIGGDGSDNLQAGDGNDTLEGGAGADYLIGGYGGYGNETLEGGAGAGDLIGSNSGSGNYDWIGGVGDMGSTGIRRATIIVPPYSNREDREDDDWLLGGEGSDILQGGGGLDRLYGGADDDSLYDGDQSWEDAIYNPTNGHWYKFIPWDMLWHEALAMATTSQLFNLQGYLATITNAEEQDFLAHLLGNESVWLGGSDADTEGTWTWINGPESGTEFYVQGQASQPGYSNWITGEPSNWGSENYLQWLGYSGQWNALPSYYWLKPLIEYGGMPGDGTAFGLIPGDLLHGDAGDDSIYSHGANDSIDGGEGYDRLDMDLTRVNQDLSLLLGDPGVAAVLSLGGSVIGVEEFSIRAGAGNDLIRTGAGRDNLQGGDGDDTLEGGDGEDVLNGGFGDDLIIGGTSGDWLSGGDGSDRFFYQNSNDGGDTITDFQLDHDYLVVSAAGFEGGLVAGMDIMASGRYVENTTGFATSASGIGQFIFQTSTDRLYWDSDGEGGLSEVYLSTISFTGAGSRIQVAL